MPVIKRDEQRREKARCVECNAPIRDPYLTGGLDVCEHRRACEARQMMQAGVSSAEAARHAQRLP